MATFYHRREDDLSGSRIAPWLLFVLLTALVLAMIPRAAALALV